MSQNYCPCCQDFTDAEEEFVDSGKQLLCQTCGTIIDDSPIQNPNSPGNPLAQHDSRYDHWSGTFQLNSDPSSRAVLQRLRVEDSSRGAKYRKDTAIKNSSLFGQIIISIHNACSKLNLGGSFAKRAEDLYVSVRGRAGLAGTSIRRVHAEALGMGCFLWICREEGLPYSADHLATVSEISKRDILSAVLKLEKVLGSPKCRMLPTVDTAALLSNEPHGLAEALELVRKSLPGSCFAQIEMLAMTLWNLGIVEDDCLQELVFVCAYLVADKVSRSGEKWTIQKLCKKYKWPCSRKMDVVEERVGRLVNIVAPRLVSGSNEISRSRTWNVHDFVKIAGELTLEDIFNDSRNL